MNIGLQPQYPTVWTIDIVLAVLMVISIVVQVAIVRRTRAQARKRFDEKHAEWEKGEKKALARVKKGEVDTWRPPEPEFVVHRLVTEPPPITVYTAIGTALLLVVMLFTTVVMTVPFNSKYYNFYVEKGTVQQVVSTVSVGSDSVTNQFTVTLAGDPKVYGLDDARIRLLQGKQVSLLCGVGWNNQAADTWTCNLRDYAGSTR